jgi:seryl-tRNA synthetase
MINPQLLRNDPAQIADLLTKKKYQFDVDSYAKLESSRKQVQSEAEALQATRNAKSKEIGKVKSQGGDIQPILDEVAGLGDQLKSKQGELEEIQAEISTLVMGMPNVPHPSVPEGDSEDDNDEVLRWGEPASFDFEVKDHVDVGEALDGMDFANAAKLSGSRFVVLKGQLAKLQRALVQFMLDVHTQEHGYQEVYVPYLVNSDSLRGTGQLPKFAEDQFKAAEDDLYLIPTAEVPVTNLFRDVILDNLDSPQKLVAHTPCFRREAGSYGRDTRGLIRQHQFEKVELVQVVKPEESYKALEELTANAETILQKLELPYRKVVLCGGDLGFSAAKTYDLEVWLPGQNAYREISSCSNFEDFQARRMQARFRNADGKPELVHTLNGSGLAVGRTLVAILENYQLQDGRVRVPVALQSYLGNEEILD